jgi:GTP-binding protein YchF
MASLEVGIVGLPNSGKTSLFNALTESHAEITSYAAVQASANVGIAAVPDERIAALAEAVSSREQVPATVQFSDVAGLVRGSGTRDGGLGAEYLGHLRATHALAHVVRCFDDEAVSHPDGRIDPVADAEAVDFELLLSDQVLVTRRRERTERAARVGEKSARDELAVLERLAAHLDGGLPARTLDVELPDGLDLLTTKPVIYVANVSEAGEPERVAALTAYATEHGAEVVAVAARFEAELAELDDPGDRAAFLADLGLDEPGMPRLARACFRTLGLITFFTAGPIEARAWPVREGASAVEAAGKIHSDIARGFIRAEVIRWDDLVAAGSHSEAQKRGVQRVEGKDYVVVDGDVLNIRFNV